MSNPFSGSSGSNSSATNSMSDPLGFIKNLWGSMNIPGMVAPPMSLDELDKKIKDLKTVESWLNVNMNMLRGTIQALEVQRATIAALHSLGESFAQHAQQASATATPASTSATDTASYNNADWPMPASSHKVPEPAVEDEEEDDIDMPPEHVDAAVSAKPEAAKSAETISVAQTDGSAQSADTSAPFATPAAWWGLLQDQFKQAVSKALENEPTFGNVATPVTATKEDATGTSRATTKSTKTASEEKPKAAAKDTTTTAPKTGTKSATKSTTKSVIKSATAKTKPISKAAAGTVVKTSVKARPVITQKKTRNKPATLVKK